MSWEALRADHKWRVVELPNVPENGVANSIADHARREGFRVHTLPALSTPIVDLRPEATTSHPNDSRAYRARLEMKLRKLGQFGEVHLRSYTTMEEPLRRLLELEPAVRKTRFRPLSPEHPGVVELLREIGMWATGRDALRIFALEINGEPISMLFGITAHDTFYVLRIAHTTRLAMYSPGQLLVMLTLQELIRTGTKQCELVGPALPWKMVWTSATRRHHSHYIFRPDSHGRTPLASLLALTVQGQKMWRHLCGRATS
jgi:CelD/BcsL family acetyltransferase involved in cellulose biosynthesis